MRVEIQDSANGNLQLVTEGERAIWALWLPRSYRSFDSFTYCDGNPIPPKVLSQLNDLRTKDVFAEFEVRSTLTSGECAVFGIRKSQFWLVARWNLGAYLWTYEEIVQKMKRRVEDRKKSRNAVSALFLAFAVGLVYLAAASAIPHDDVGSALYLFLVAAFACFIAWEAQWDCRDSLWRALQKVGQTTQR
jgi:hypothetical protein